MKIICYGSVSYTHLDVYKRQNNYRAEGIAKNTIEIVDKRLEENLEATEERIAILTTEIHEEISDIRREGENNKQKITQYYCCLLYTSRCV